jgi:hypothetical protein
MVTHVGMMFVTEYVDVAVLFVIGTAEGSVHWVELGDGCVVIRSISKSRWDDWYDTTIKEKHTHKEIGA